MAFQIPRKPAKATASPGSEAGAIYTAFTNGPSSSPEPRRGPVPLNFRVGGRANNFVLAEMRG